MRKLNVKKNAEGQVFVLVVKMPVRIPVACIAVLEFNPQLWLLAQAAN